jgi:hypothetical protein
MHFALYPNGKMVWLQRVVIPDCWIVSSISVVEFWRGKAHIIAGKIPNMCEGIWRNNSFGIKLSLAKVILTDVDCRLELKDERVAWFKDPGYVCPQSTPTLFTRNRYNSRSSFVFEFFQERRESNGNANTRFCSVRLRSCWINDNAEFC